MDRRPFLRTCLGAALVSALRTPLGAAAERGRPRILLRSSWQTVNIGDIAHTPGVLALLERYLPDAEIRLWPSSVENGVAEMLLRRFPQLKIVKTADEVSRSFTECDFLLHGSGPALVAKNDVKRWHQGTGKPFGIYGITLPAPEAEVLDLISQAKFAFFRDSVSLELARSHGARCPIMEFGPDGAFAVDLRHDEAALEFMNKSGLEPSRFLCCIPRLRYTPYWKIKGTAFDPEKHQRNEQKKEADHAPLREAIIAVVRRTPMRVLICPEDQSQMEVGRELLYAPLPEDVRRQVVWREKYWLTDEALSTYVRSAGLFGLEMHSPIMCIGNGIPAIVCRFREQTSKGLMWRDIGLGDWLCDMDQPEDVARIVPVVLSLAENPRAAQAHVARARQFVEQRQRETMQVLAKANLP